ncbi:MAG: hypothetical protein HQL24_08625 [Candidatus Omnitrophica bacterium]|nr:hypothetical protein [Candidatus Omnitrophota bacterium]
MTHDILVPRINSNDDSYILVEWEFSAGDFVKEGDVLCVIETSKSTFEIHAEESGYIHIFVHEHSKIKEGDAICRLSKEKEMPLNEKFDLSRNPSLASDKQIKATKKAIETARDLGVDLGKMMGDGIISQKDVEAFAQSQNVEDKKQQEVSFVTFKMDRDRIINDEFLKELLKDLGDRREFASLPSQKKIEIYRDKGALIGEDVKFERGSCIISQFMDIGAGTVFGENSVFQSKAMKIGRMCRFGDQLRVASTLLDIGDLLFTDNGIKIGEGGEWGPESILKIGDSCFIGEECMINTSRTVTIGNEVCLAYGAKIFTHNFWQPVLDGYAALFNPVKINDGSVIGVNVVIMPGVEVGAGSSVLTNSLLATNVPSGSVYAGIPAMMIKPAGSYPINLSYDEREKMIYKIFESLAEDLSFKGDDAQVLQEKEGVKLIWRNENTVFVYRRRLKSGDDLGAGAFKRWVLLTFENVLEDLKDAITVFDLSKKEVNGKQDEYSDELREALRKRGIRFKPILWRYKRRAQWIDLPMPLKFEK